VNSLVYSLVSSDLNRHPPQQDIATAKTVRTFLIAETIAITASSFFLLPTSIGLLLYYGFFSLFKEPA